MSEKPMLTGPNVLSSGTDDSTSLSLLERAKTQDAAAWSRLVQLYEPLVTQWCRLRQLQEADTADIRQEVFLAVARKLSEFRREPPHYTFRGWLRTITRNKIIDHARRQKNHPEAPGGSDAQALLAALPDDTPEEESSVHEEKSLLVRRALEVLATEFEPTTWQAFWRTSIDGAEPKLVAEELQLSTGAVYTARSRVRQRLEKEFCDVLEL